MKIKILIEIMTTRPDTCGNRYSVAAITNPINGKSARIDMGWGDGSNIIHDARKLGLEWGEIYATRREGLTRRELDRMATEFHETETEKAFRAIGLRARS